ncbi:MAG: hypothetical protein U9N83_02575 [Thermodesulfobacteriota bacterium]|nr:hypothetical protein [Thermodesulfobacteriota bacterium]
MGDFKFPIKVILEMLKKFSSILFLKIKKLKSLLKWGALATLIAVVTFYITLQINKPLITLRPEQFGDCMCYLAVGLKDGKPASQITFVITNTGNIVAKNIESEWHVSEAFTKTVGKWTLSQDRSDKTKIAKGPDLEPNGQYTQSMHWFFVPKKHSIKDILNDFKSNNGYLTFDVTVTYQNGLFPFIKHKLIIQDRYFNKETQRFAQKYSFY